MESVNANWKGLINVIQKVKTWPVNNKDTNVAAVFPIIMEHLRQARKKDLNSTNFTWVLLVPVSAFWWYQQFFVDIHQTNRT